jgi:para-aminobenzoate synthetase component I
MQVRQLEWIDPVAAASRLVRLPHMSLLDSAMAHPRLGRYSYLAADPFGVFAVRDGRAAWNGTPEDAPALEALRRRLAACRVEPIAGLPPFQSGAIGVFGYEFGWRLEGRTPPHPGVGDEVHLAFYDVVLAFDHVARACWLISSGLPAAEGTGRQRRAAMRLDAVMEVLDQPAPDPAQVPEIVWHPTITRAAYAAGIARVQELIRAGDIYQANIAQRFVADLPREAEPWALYKAVRDKNPAPFAAYLDCGARKVLSSSPELFLRTEGGAVETRPIKGTARRHDDAQEDAARRAALFASRKDRAENVMIVDLLRNDLAKVCTPTSVEVPVLCALESYAGLHHLVSAVTGTLRQSVDALDLVAAAFPGGSITGAPKLRAMEIIAEIEGRARGVYCGAIGAVGFSGDVALNIAIRTLVIEGSEIELRTGGGITILSDADQEYEETLTKANRVLAAFSRAPAEAEA